MSTRSPHHAAARAPLGSTVPPPYTAVKFDDFSCRRWHPLSAGAAQHVGGCARLQSRLRMCLGYCRCYHSFSQFGHRRRACLTTPRFGVSRCCAVRTLFRGARVTPNTCGVMLITMAHALAAPHAPPRISFFAPLSTSHPPTRSHTQVAAADLQSKSVMVMHKHIVSCGMAIKCTHCVAAIRQSVQYGPHRV